MYRFIQDPGHGWLEVPRAELEALGIADDISRYSYQSRDGATAYLEEDCDMSRFYAAKGWTGATAPVVEVYQENTFIRLLPQFRGAVLA